MSRFWWWADWPTARALQRFMKKFQIGEREAAKILGISHTQISLCVGLARTSEALIRGLSKTDAASLEPVFTMTKYAAIGKLPERQKVVVLQGAVKERLSDCETKRVVTEVQSGKGVERAVAGVVNERETRRRTRPLTMEKMNGKATCLRCKKPALIEHLRDGSHRVLDDVA